MQKHLESNPWSATQPVYMYKTKIKLKLPWTEVSEYPPSMHNNCKPARLSLFHIYKYRRFIIFVICIIRAEKMNQLNQEKSCRWHFIRKTGNREKKTVTLFMILSSICVWANTKMESPQYKWAKNIMPNFLKISRGSYNRKNKYVHIIYFLKFDNNSLHSIRKLCYEYQLKVFKY